MQIKSFRQMLASQGQTSQKNQEDFLFSKLKEEKRKNKALTMPNSLQGS